ncbi:RHS repeat-associated core domain-containing protein [Nonomuraea sp. NPDC003804]|uniref:RHS repeat-associated core domain-containing protein n=1 Tax=Nonomuraea sp. NPDC003804 TaxID=3154547 RepID=UPI0033B6EDBC
MTTDAGDTRATYGYTAYGKNDDKLFTGVDKPDPVDPTAKEEYNPYRFNAKRWDNSTGMYDMGFRDYNPGLNRFLNLDSYNGALDDLSLGLDPWTANRYAFTSTGTKAARLANHAPPGVDPRPAISTLTGRQNVARPIILFSPPGTHAEEDVDHQLSNLRCLHRHGQREMPGTVLGASTKRSQHGRPLSRVTAQILPAEPTSPSSIRTFWVSTPARRCISQDSVSSWENPKRIRTLA